MFRHCWSGVSNLCCSAWRRCEFCLVALFHALAAEALLELGNVRPMHSASKYVRERESERETGRNGREGREEGKKGKEMGGEGREGK